ncbi:MAG TPA: AAA family ATPase [Tepidisphaeraceae bacterium]|nr:AAA family ATPase [Tepidisphaeraceae bacterium]
MYIQLNSIIVDPDAANRQELANFFAQYGVNIVGQYPTAEHLPNFLARSDAPQLVVINLDPGGPETLKKIASLPKTYPNTSFLLMSQVVDPHLLMEAMHLGVKEFIPLPVPEEKFAAAMERIAQLHGMNKTARIIHVIPTMGGCGSTTISCNVAASLAQSSKSVLLDMDLMRGGCASYFDLRPKYTIADVMDSAEKVDRQLLDNALTVHAASKLAVLARPDMPEDTQRINQAGLNRLMAILARTFEYVVIDSLMSISPIYASLINSADFNVIVLQLNVPSVRNTERFVMALRRMGIAPEKIRVVVNRYVKRGWDIEPGEVERALGIKLEWLIPNDFKNAIGAINYGEPVVLRAPKCEMTQSLNTLANSLKPMNQDARRAA